ncbi:hypothetical protein [uncultured Aquimarina sp.]|uniref:hypothetical protein n=1 Tax=uncultured Aquimarina sp. TaxID=575652 RepID=UPI0026083A36|nr:hypothetical protein [uncultured Aquimarina sp.]
MVKFKATDTKTDQLKWIIYMILGFAILFYINKYSNWHPISKFLFSFPLIINLIFDFIYFRKEKAIITELKFDENLITIIYKNRRQNKINYSNLKYSIRKRKFDKHKTEIELKKRKGLIFKTIGRLHIRNWDEIFDIEKELETQKIPRVAWKPKTLWGKYWGIFIELFFISAGESLHGDIIDYQEKSIKEVTENPIEEKNNT